MRIEADDEIYRVNAVWLGPGEFPLPWRATYRSYGIGVLLFGLGLGVVRQVYGITFWSVVFMFVFVIKLTQIISKRMGYERPISAVLSMAVHEMTGPRRSNETRGVPPVARDVPSRRGPRRSTRRSGGEAA